MYKTTGNTTIGKSRRKFESMERIRANAVGLVAFNGGTEHAELIHGATPVKFAPSGLWIGPGDSEPREYDGITVLRDEYGTDPEAIRLARPAAKQSHSALPYQRVPKDRLIARAIDIGARAEQKLRHRGVVILTGDPEQDERLKKDAREAWIKYRLDRAERADAAYRKRHAAFWMSPHRVATENPPSKSRFENAEQAWLDEYNDGRIGGRKYVCKHKCGFEHDDAAIMTRHVRVAHAARRDEGQAEESAPSDVVVVPKKRGRPRRVESATAPVPA